MVNVWLILFVLVVAVLAEDSNVSALANQDDVLKDFDDPSDSASLVFPSGEVYDTTTVKTNIYTYHYDHFLTFDQAHDFCYGVGGELLSIMNQNQQRGIEGLLKRRQDVEEFLIIWLNGKITNCVWRWQWTYTYKQIIHEINHDINHAYSFTNWADSEPSAPCIGISNDPFFEFGKWRTDDCAERHAFICQFDECQRWTDNQARCKSYPRKCLFESDGICRKIGSPIHPR